MTPFQSFSLYFSLLVFGFVWLKGGHTERHGVVVLIVGYLASHFVTHWRLDEWHLDDWRVGETAVDVVVTLIFAWMALSHARWWTFTATAVMVLTLQVHLSMVLVPELDERADVSARIGLGLLLVLSLLTGVAERWLSGEKPVSCSSVWKRPTSALTSRKFW